MNAQHVFEKKMYVLNVFFIFVQERRRRKKNRARRGVPGEFSSVIERPPSLPSDDPNAVEFFDPTSLRFQKLDLQRQSSGSSSGSYKTADEEEHSERFLASFLPTSCTNVILCPPYNKSKYLDIPETRLHVNRNEIESEFDLLLFKVRIKNV